MKIYIAYRFTGEDPDIVRKNTEAVAQAVQDAGHTPFIFNRDIQQWGAVELTLKEIYQQCLEQIQKHDAILVFANSTEKSEGMLIECGYAKGLNKKIIIAAYRNIKPHWLHCMADMLIEFDTMDELRQKIKEILSHE